MAGISSVTSLPLHRSSTEMLQLLKVDLAKTQRELSSGKLDDTGLSLGFRTADVLRIKIDELRFTTMRDANGLARARLDVAQAGLTDINDIAQKYAGALLAARDSENTSLPVIGTARSSINAMFDRLNASYDGAYVFAGTNIETPPMSDYFAQPAGTARQAVAAAFTATFGMAQNDPAVATITPAAMTAFLTGPFADLFADPAWGQDWSSASSDNMVTQVSSFETVETSTSANHSTLRKLASSMVMLADLGIDGMSPETRRVLLNAASDTANGSLGELARLQGEIGDRQARISTATKRLDIQVNFAKAELGNMVDVDATETAVRAADLMQRIEASYELTGRLMRLSLLNSI